MRGTVIQDIRYGWRVLAKTPGVTAVVILSLALGIGANTAIFTLINAVMLKALPVQDPGRLALFGDGSQSGFMSELRGRWNIFSYPLYEALRNDPSFTGVCAFQTRLDRLRVSWEAAAGNEPAQVAWGKLVSGNYFLVLGVPAVVGRTFVPEDDRPGAPPVAVISHEYWKRAFNLDRSSVGRPLNVNGVLLTLVGVTPPGFFGESVEAVPADLWLPMALQPQMMPQRGSVLNNAEVNWINLMGRLRPGVSLKQAQAGVNVTFQQFLRQQAGSRLTPERERELAQSHIELTPGARGVSQWRLRYSRFLQILWAVVVLVLIIACANVANVLLSRATAREKEIAMRLALGAGRSRIFAQLLTESVLLAGLGAALGLLVAAAGVKLLVAAVSTDGRAAPLAVAPDARTLGFTLAVALVTGVLFGLAPALRASQVDLSSALKGAVSGAGGRKRRGLMKGLVVSQVALSLPLLAGAGLFLRTLERLNSQELGFNREGVLEVGIDPRIAGYKPDQLDGLYQALLDRVNALPGVRVATLSLYSPMSGSIWSGAISLEGYVPAPDETARAQWVWVGPRYVETLGMSLLLGRDLGPQDNRGTRKVAVVNESFARKYFAGRSVLGRRFSLEVPVQVRDIEIVGVVKDFKFNTPRQTYWPVVFMPLSQSAFPPAHYAMYLEVRTKGDPAAVAGAVRQALREVDGNLPVTSIKTLSRQVDDSLSRERLIAGLSSFFGLLALLLACVGLYGVLAYAVTRRSREIGIRMALGAHPADVVKMVLREGFCLISIGAGIGLLASLAVLRLVSSQLYELKPLDPLTIASATIVLAAAAVLAGYIPARRASRLDPTATLRTE